MSGLPRPIVQLVTDRRRTTPEARTPGDEIAGLERWLDAATGAGVDLIQIRERDLEAAPLVRLVRTVAARAAGTATRVLVNDRVDVAVAADAGGVHLRADAPDAARVRALLPPGALVGRSTHEVAEIEHHAPSCDYLLFGSVFPTTSKPAGWRASGLEALADAVTAAAGRTPVVAIGGITPESAGLCAAAGAAGIAGIGLFLPAAAGGPAGLARLVDALRRALSSGPPRGDAGPVV